MNGNVIRPWKRRARLLGVLMALSFFIVPELVAVGAGNAMPWNTPLQAILNSVTGPTAQLIIGFGTVGAGLYWIFAGHEGGSKWLGRVVIGGVLILFAQTIISWASFGGAVL